MDHAAVSEPDHRLIMRLLWAFPNTGHLYSVIIGFLAHRRKNEPSFRFAIWPSRVPSVFSKGKSGSARPARTRTTARRYGCKAVRGARRPPSLWLPRVCSHASIRQSHTGGAVSDAWRDHVRDDGD
jgi:hypothetical protein